MSGNLFWGIVIALVVAALYRSYRKQEARRVLRAKLAPSLQDAPLPANDLGAADEMHLCRNFMNSNDWDAARQSLQKVAATIQHEDEAAQQRFKKLKADLAAQDPLA